MNSTATFAILALTLILAALDGALACYLTVDTDEDVPAAPKQMSLSSPLAGGHWRVDSIDGVPLPEGVYPILKFGTDGKLGGHFGCNSITADYSGDPDRLDIGSVFLTRATCEAAKATVEADLYAILRGRLRITLPEDTDWVIELTSPEGRVIRLGRVVYR